MPRGGLRRASEYALRRLGAGLSRPRTRGATLVLAWHNVVPDLLQPVGDRSLHLSRSDFAAQLDLLQRWCDVVPLTALAAAPSHGARARAVITFDDASRGAVTLGVAELARRGLPATIFVAPGVLDGHTFWWDELAAAVPGGAVPTEVRQVALEAGQGRQAEALRLAATRGFLPRGDLLPDVARTATVAELQAAAATPGITLGSHSWSHPNLAAVNVAECEQELRDSLEWLRTRFPGAMVPWVAYPYGLESPAVQEAAARAGYVGGLLISGGWLGRGAHPGFATPRRNVPAGISADRFALILSGFPGL